MSNDKTATVKRTEKTQKRRRLPRGRVTIFPNWCKGCGLCVEFCPTGVLEQRADGSVTAAHPEACTACRWCELHCPDFAIFVTDIEPETAPDTPEPEKEAPPKSPPQPVEKKGQQTKKSTAREEDTE